MTNIKEWSIQNQKKKSEHFETASVTAQRLINLYRHIDSLKDDELNAFNQTILNEVNESVLNALSSIPGGHDIKEYVLYIQNSKHVDMSDNFNSINNAISSKLLPSAEELSPLWDMMSFNSTAESDKQFQKQLLKIEEEILSVIPEAEIKEKVTEIFQKYQNLSTSQTDKNFKSSFSSKKGGKFIKDTKNTSFSVNLVDDIK